ncbi:Disease resistance protein [Melia azedarach]|uniref:Disease resistance protein n=1 Tax=Melia azedarach TaxID=155640 RepID=A0ACC1YKE8_MELAZ|nr:Disease resistance protein [Melia azedarach]
MADKLSFLLDLECARLDSHADAFWNNKDLKQFRLKLAEVQYLLRDAERYRLDKNSLLGSCFTDLRNLAYDVDQLIDDWEQSEISKPKFAREVRRIHGLLAGLLNSFNKLGADYDKGEKSFSEVSYGNSDECAVLERHDQTFTDILNSLLLLDDNNGVRVIPIVGMGGIGKTALAQRIYNHEEVKTHFPFRAWISVGNNLRVSTVAKEIRVLLFERDIDHRDFPWGGFPWKTLIVLDDVGDEDDGKLVQLKSEFPEGSHVLVTTRYDRVAALLGTVGAHYLTFSELMPESTVAGTLERSQIKFMERRSVLKFMDMRSALRCEPQRDSTPGRDDEMTSDLPGQFKVPTDTVPPYKQSEVFTDKDPLSSPENLIEDKITSPPRIDSPYAESVSTMYEYPTSSPENLIEDKITSPPPIDGLYAESVSTMYISSPEYLSEDEMRYPQAMETQSAHESEIEPATLEAGDLAVHVPGTIATTSDGKEMMLPIHQMKLEAGPSQKEGEGQVVFESNANVHQLVEPMVPMAPIKLGTSDIIAEKSIRRNVQKIFKFVNDAKVSKIGVHGIGGIGKTTLLEALINHPGMKKMFHMIILVTVSRYWSTRKIQKEVLRQLSLSCKDYETDPQLAEKLLRVIHDKKFLLLLDDVWEQIDLEAVGIPIPSSENECKIIIASREPDVCQNMNVSKLIELKTLPWKEAWKLFYKEVGRIIHSPDIQPFARAIVKGCRGLPLLIIVTGRALMEENNVVVWEHASKKFSPPTSVRIYQTKDVIQLLKFSFDQLKDYDIKSCFLYCGLFPEDREVNILQFIDYCIQEGIISGTGADACERGRGIVDVLVHASLLQVTEHGNSIRMHGLIRDLALGILSSAAEDNQHFFRAEGSQFLLGAYSRLTEPPNTGNSLSSSSVKCSESGKLFIPETHQFFLGAGADLIEPPSEEEWKQAKMVFLMDNKLSSLPERPSCPNLLTLFLQRNLQLRVIPPSFFESMTSLKVLNLSNTRINSLPKTIVKLENLQILILRDCERLLMLPAEVGSLECLEVLDLRGSEINELPNEIGKLTFLRYLDVYFYGPTDESEYVKLPPNLMSSETIAGLQALETLSIVVHPEDERWYRDVEFVITEVNKLTKLSSLHFHFPEIEHVKQFLNGSVSWKDQRLTKFKFVIGDDVKSIISRVPDYLEFDYNQRGKCLKFVNGEDISPEVLQILARSTAFYLDHHLDINSLSDFGVSIINGLKFCITSECPQIETVVNIEEDTTVVFPNLENLSIHHLWNLTCICKEIVADGSFAELRILSVHTCPKLEYIFKSSMIQLLTKLEELTVEDCSAVESIILEGEIVDSSCIALPSLKKLRLHYLPGLVNIWRSAWPLLECISFYDCPQLKKIGMDSKLKDSVVEIKAEKDWWYGLEWEDTDMRSHFEDRLTLICEDM